ncbi:MAG: hypothetical protein IJM95_06690 [Anaerotignum sp.]|nr:hypothetical protein [Anaerotignum sp.]
MKTAKIRFLEKGEAARLPKGMKLLPKAVQQKYIETCGFYRLTAERDVLTGILQTEAENGMVQVWRKNAVKLMERLKKEGIEIVIPPIEGELPRDILPFAEGRKLTNLFAFEGAAEALRRQGKNPEECRYLMVGGNEDAWRAALTSMGNEVNHLAIFTLDPDSAKELIQELFEERGLMTEVFSSPKNQVFSQADVVFGCGMEQRAYEFMLKEGTIWIDLAGNRPVLRRLMEKRPDVVAVDGFFFKKDGLQTEGRFAEAEAFLSCPIFRENFRFSLAEAARNEMLCELQEKGYAVSGFSALGKRVKIRRNP